MSAETGAEKSPAQRSPVDPDVRADLSTRFLSMGGADVERTIEQIMSKVPAKAKEVAVPLDMDWGSKIGLKDQYESLHPPLIKLLQGQEMRRVAKERRAPPMEAKADELINEAIDEIAFYLAFVKVFATHNKDVAQAFRGCQTFEEGSEYAEQLKKAKKMAKKASGADSAAGKGKGAAGQPRAEAPKPKRPRPAYAMPPPAYGYAMPPPPAPPAYAWAAGPSNGASQRCHKCGGFGHWAKSCPAKGFLPNPK